MHRYTIILSKGQSEPAYGWAWVAKGNSYILGDTSEGGNYRSRCSNLRFATFISDISELMFDHTKDRVGNVEDIRPITGIEMWELFKEVPNMHIPQSLRTPEFIEYMKCNYPDYYTGPPMVMTGKQFKELYPGQKIRLFNYIMIHNDFPWKEDLNVCADFDPGHHCGKGLYFIEESEKLKWLEYGGKKMFWWAYIDILDEATVAIEEGKFCTNMMRIPKFFKL